MWFRRTIFALRRSSRVEGWSRGAAANGGAGDMMADDRDARIAQLEAALLSVRSENGSLRAENAALQAERSESLDQQTATAEILRIIASSPTDLQGVLDAVAERAVRVCNAEDAQIFRLQDDVVYLTAHNGPMTIASYYRDGRPYDRTYVAGRAMLDQRPIHIDDYGAVYEAEYPEAYRQNVQRGLSVPGHWTLLCVPLLRDGAALGAITVRRVEVRPFTE